ncbi:hypothetical protein BDN72DRAFT_778127 [Pluteus cervinus]|uniref:Uncharacterized protein n=1 Tax=Pluteus cervinus TaxID=181527 RepID=A0ACD3A717_9AGAR|nr:hypothetical protein BDN72DRAFT_778127 [Pluteus cervinus]
MASESPTTEPSTRIVDHLVHLSPPGSVEQASQQFRDLGFTVIPGGTHAGGLTANALVLLADGAYLELISFIHPIEFYPPNSDERRERESHNWAKRAPGWIDWAFLGNTTYSTPISRISNDRASIDGSGVHYKRESNGGRTRPDGEVLRWVISQPRTTESGVLPFFCGDITPRPLRVPATDTNTSHKSTVRGVAHIHLVVRPASFESLTLQFTTVVGAPPKHVDASKAVWSVDTLAQPEIPTEVILTIPQNPQEHTFVESLDSGTASGVYEIAFGVLSGSERRLTTPYGRIAFVPLRSG